MCGIAGIVEVSTSEPRIDYPLLKKMSDVIIHRGPDSEGQWVADDRRCGLAFRRLSIIDLSDAGNQPMQSSDGRYTVVFNGEIYNHLEIRRELEELGYQYHSRTDTETILNGFKQWGGDIVDKLNGMFAFAIWDSEKNELFCARDRVGKKPLYYYFKDGVFVFGSEIKSILLHPSVSTEFNEQELPNYLNWAMSSNRNSLFKNIHKLPAAHCLKLTAKGDLNTYRYWSAINKDTQYVDMSEKELTDEILRLLKVSIKDRMMSDVPFGVFLSGGIDSSLNVALMADLMDRPVDTFTVGFKELEKYNELKYAKQIADLYKTNHNEILIDEKDSFSILTDLPWYEDEPNGDPVCIPLYFLSKFTRELGTIVILVGEGSDELFMGYPWMHREYNFYKSYWKWFTALPQSMRKIAYNSAKPLFIKAGQYHALDYLRRATYNEEHYWGGMSIFTPVQQEFLLKKEYRNLIPNLPAFAAELHEEARSLKPGLDYMQEIFFVELNQRLAELLFMRVDKIGMAHSIEARLPFMDTRLIEFVMSIPERQKIPDKKSTKYLLKKAVEPILPHNIIYRRKQGFWAPVTEWLRNEWYDYAFDKITNSGIIIDYFNLDYVKLMFENHKNSKANNGLKIFQLLQLALWWERFFK
jgi:asparagine synthase (glutamine-hydrolysing)